MANCIGAAGESGDLFGGKPIPRRDTASKSNFSPDLKAARVLCRQMRRRKPRPEKQRIAHLICLSLASMLRNGPRQAQTAPDE